MVGTPRSPLPRGDPDEPVTVPASRPLPDRPVGRRAPSPQGRQGRRCSTGEVGLKQRELSHGPKGTSNGQHTDRTSRKRPSWEDTTGRENARLTRTYLVCRMWKGLTTR